jgi:hypothetical protein
VENGKRNRRKIFKKDLDFDSSTSSSLYRFYIRIDNEFAYVLSMAGMIDTGCIQEFHPWGNFCCGNKDVYGTMPELEISIEKKDYWK